MPQRTAGKLGLLLTVGLAMVLLTSATFAGAAPRRSLQRKVLLTALGPRSVTVARGDTIVVTLMGEGLTLWSETSIVSDTPTTPPVLVKTGGRVLAGGTSKTTFRVVGYGSVMLQALAKPDCVPTYETACPDVISVWQATVSVPVVDSPSAL